MLRFSHIKTVDLVREEDTFESKEDFKSHLNQIRSNIKVDKVLFQANHKVAFLKAHWTPHHTRVFIGGHGAPPLSLWKSVHFGMPAYDEKTCWTQASELDELPYGQLRQLELSCDGRWLFVLTDSGAFGWFDAIEMNNIYWWQSDTGDANSTGANSRMVAFELLPDDGNPEGGVDRLIRLACIAASDETTLEVRDVCAFQPMQVLYTTEVAANSKMVTSSRSR